jgi:hypothetical protein
MSLQVQLVLQGLFPGSLKPEVAFPTPCPSQHFQAEESITLRKCDLTAKLRRHQMTLNTQKKNNRLDYSYYQKSRSSKQRWRLEL